MTNLQKYFPEITSLYNYQNEALDYLSDANTLTVVPTGGGKSLIYQLAAINFDGVTIVVSPLLALMSEQVDELNDRGIPSIALNSSMSLVNQRDYLRDFDKHNDKIIYLSPERLANTFFQKIILQSRRKISLIAIDEAHCISQWGDDFRPEYSLINKFISLLEENNQKPRVLALTATLSVRPREDIKKIFKIEKEIIHEKIIRDNLHLSFQKVEQEDQKLPYLIDFINKPEVNASKVLVYLYSKQKCEEFSKYMQESYGIQSRYFHADMESEEKQKTFEYFKESKIRVLFATSAFGMGINIPDIDAVIHLHIPNSIEEYYQQVGRGARKIPQCHCLLLWSDKNFDSREKYINGAKIEDSNLHKAYKIFYFENNKGRTKSVNLNNLQDNKNSNLSQIRFQFEKQRLVEYIGHSNGTPLTVRFRLVKGFWKEFVSEIDETMDNFEIAAKLSGKSIKDVIDFLYEEDIQGNIEYLPAMTKYMFFNVFYDKVPEDVAEKIVKEINETVKEKLNRLKDLKKLVENAKPEEFIRSKLTEEIVIQPPNNR